MRMILPIEAGFRGPWLKSNLFTLDSENDLLIQDLQLLIGYGNIEESIQDYG